MMLKKSAPLLVIIGPSAAGKTSVVRKLVEEGIVAVTPSWTTRPRRPEELDGTEEHVFCTNEEFEAAKEQGQFLAAAQLFGLPYWYGLPQIQQPKGGRIPLIMLRIMVLEMLYKFYDNPIIYQIEAPESDVASRLKQRSMKGDDIGTRLSDYEKEVISGRRVASRCFINTDITETVHDIRAAIKEDFTDVPESVR